MRAALFDGYKRVWMSAGEGYTATVNAAFHLHTTRSMSLISSNRTLLSLSDILNLCEQRQ